LSVSHHIKDDGDDHDDVGTSSFHVSWSTCTFQWRSTNVVLEVSCYPAPDDATSPVYTHCWI